VTELERYLCQLEQNLSKYFVVKKHAIVAERPFLLVAHHTNTIGRTLLTEKDIIDQYEVSTIILVHTAENLEQIRELTQWLKEHMREVVQPSSDRYYTLINLVAIFENHIPEDARQFSENYTLRKSFLFSLRGWAQAGLTCVCLPDRKAFCGKGVQDMKQLFAPSPDHESSHSGPAQAQTEQSFVKYTPFNEEAV